MFNKYIIIDYRTVYSIINNIIYHLLKIFIAQGYLPLSLLPTYHKNWKFVIDKIYKYTIININIKILFYTTKY